VQSSETLHVALGLFVQRGAMDGVGGDVGDADAIFSILNTP